MITYEFSITRIIIDKQENRLTKWLLEHDGEPGTKSYYHPFKRRRRQDLADHDEELQAIYGSHKEDKGIIPYENLNRQLISNLGTLVLIIT